MKHHAIALGLGLALSLGAVSAASAQDARPNRPAAQQDRGDRGGRRGPGGPGGFLLKDITLTDAQKQQLQALRPARGERGATTQDPQRAQMRTLMEQARELRQKGDSAGAAAKMTQARALMTRQREREVAQIRAILTPAQRTQFDKNVAEMKARQSDRGERGPRGEHGRR